MKENIKEEIEIEKEDIMNNDLDDVSEMTDDELEKKLSELTGGNSSNQEIQTIHGFLNAVATSDDTTKTGYITEEELGQPKLPVRTYKELALFCRDVANMDYMAKYFEAKSEIVTSTSLSKNAKLLNLSVLNKKEVADVTKKNTSQKRSWFKPKGKINNEEDIEQ